MNVWRCLHRERERERERHLTGVKLKKKKNQNFHFDCSLPSNHNKTLLYQIMCVREWEN